MQLELHSLLVRAVRGPHVVAGGQVPLLLAAEPIDVLSHVHQLLRPHLLTICLFLTATSNSHDPSMGDCAGPTVTVIAQTCNFPTNTLPSTSLLQPKLF